MQLTRTPAGPHSRARLLASPRWAALATPYAGRYGLPSTPAADVSRMSEPCARLEVRVGGVRAQVRRPHRGAEHRLPGLVGDVLDGVGVADRCERVVHHHVEATELGDRERDRGVDVGAFA